MVFDDSEVSDNLERRACSRGQCLLGYLLGCYISYDCMRGAAVVLGVLSTTHGPRAMTERVSHGDCLAVLHPRTVFGV